MQVNVKLTDADYATVQAAAKAGGFKTVATYIRAAALVSAGVKVPDELEILKNEVKDYNADQ